MSEQTSNGVMRILLVEDNPADVLLVEEALREHNIEAQLEVVSDGESGYQYWDRFNESNISICPDLTLIDLNLPKRSGLDILQRIRETPCCAQIRVIVLSSSSVERDVERARALGIEHYFRKPSHLHEFLDLGRLIKRSAPAAANGR